MTDPWCECHTGNGRFDQGIKQALLSAAGSGGSGGSAPPPPPPTGSHQIHPNGNKAKCLDVKGGVLANGTPVQMYVSSTDSQ